MYCLDRLLAIIALKPDFPTRLFFLLSIRVVPESSYESLLVSDANYLELSFSRLEGEDNVGDSLL